MDQNAITINGVTPNALWVFMFVLVALCAVAVTVLTLFEKISGLKKRASQPSADAQEEIREMLANDKRRLDAHETAILEIRNKQSSLEDGQRAICNGVMALLDHELHNGNSDQMQKASTRINDYLINK